MLTGDPTITEIEELCIQFNYQIWEETSDEDQSYVVSFSSNGDVINISFCDIVLWSTEWDERAYPNPENLDERENLRTYLEGLILGHIKRMNLITFKTK